MSLLLRSVVGFMSLSVCLCSTGDAQVARGTVTDTAGQPIPGAEVRFISPDGLVAVSVNHLRSRSTRFVLSAPPPMRRFVVYYVAACAEGYAPQIVTPPFARGDTLDVAFELAPTARRPSAPIGDGACNWKQDGFGRTHVQRNGSFASDAAIAAAAHDAFVRDRPHDAATARDYVHRIVAQRDSALRAATSADARERAAYMMISPLESYIGSDAAEIGARVLNALPADSRWWTSISGMVQFAVPTLFNAPTADDTTQAANAIRARMRAYLEQMTLIGEPSTSNEARVTLVTNAYAAGDSARGQLLLTQLLKDQPNYQWSRLVAGRYDNGKLDVGKRLPPFDLPPLPDTSGRHVTNATLRSRLTLISFWGTWCRRCTRELPALDSLYHKYYSSGLEILSVAADDSPETVNTFRREQYPMRWLNAFGGDTQSRALQDAGVVSYPTLVLVDSTGTIVASKDMLAPDRIGRTLAGFLTH